MFPILLDTDVTVIPARGRDFYHVPYGKIFDAVHFAGAFGLNVHDIDPDDIHAVQDAAAQLLPGQFLRVKTVPNFSNISENCHDTI